MRLSIFALIIVVNVFVLSGCAGSPGEIMEQVKYDFGMGEKPEGYVSGADRVMMNLRDVGEAELARLNMENRDGEIKAQQESGMKVKFYKEVKVYEDVIPLDARPVTRAAEGDRGFLGFIAYEYTVYESARVNTRTEAQAERPIIPSENRGREVYRYHFSSGGTWDGKPGERTKL